MTVYYVHVLITIIIIKRSVNRVNQDERPYAKCHDDQSDDGDPDCGSKLQLYSNTGYSQHQDCSSNCSHWDQKVKHWLQWATVKLQLQSA